jgi:hypothetical protein
MTERHLSAILVADVVGYIGQILAGEKPANRPVQADEIRPHHQSQDQHSARRHHPALDPLARADGVIE